MCLTPSTTFNSLGVKVLMFSTVLMVCVFIFSSYFTLFLASSLHSLCYVCRTLFFFVRARARIHSLYSHHPRHTARYHFARLQESERGVNLFFDIDDEVSEGIKLYASLSTTQPETTEPLKQVRFVALPFACAHTRTRTRTRTRTHTHTHTHTNSFLAHANQPTGAGRTCIVG
jgi:hypothetical protein